MSKKIIPKDGYWFTEANGDPENRTFASGLIIPTEEEAQNWKEVTDDWKNDWESKHSENQDNGDTVIDYNIKDIIDAKVKEIEDYDKSDKVNSFTYNGVSGWIDNPTRTSYTASVQNAELLGEDSIDILFNGQVLTLDLNTAKVMLARISRYADKCWMVTQNHINQVKAMTTAKEVEEFDITKDYPVRLEF